MRTRVIALVAGVSLLILIGSGFALWRVSKTGTVLSLTSPRREGTLYFDGPQKVGVQQPFTLKVMVDTSDQSANAVGFFMRFDPEKIQVTDMSTLASFCQFYPDKKFDNRMGLVSMTCGAPHPGVKGKNEILELRLMPLSIGVTQLQVTHNSKLLLSDGKGTNILTEYPAWEVQIGAEL